MKYNAEQVAFMLYEAIDQDREYKSWHCSTKHLMTLVERVVAEEREACAKVADGWPDYDVQGLAEAIRARGKARTENKLLSWQTHRVCRFTAWEKTGKNLSTTLNASPPLLHLPSVEKFLGLLILWVG